MFTKTPLYKATLLLLPMILTFLLLGSLYSMSFVYKVDDQLLTTLKVNNKEKDIHRNLLDNVTQIYTNTQNIVSAENSSDISFRENLIDKSIAAIKKNREICIHRGTVLKIGEHVHSFKSQGENLIAFFKLKNKVLEQKRKGNMDEVKKLNENLKVLGLQLIDQTLKKGISIVGEENNLKLNHLSNNNKKKLQLGVLISILFFLIGSFFLFLFMRRYKKHNEALEAIALRDNLTGVCNRSSFINKANEYLLDHSDKGFSIVFFDIDNFKKINTRYGHHKGNDALLSFSKRIISFFKKDNEMFLARFGGDEFVLLIKNVSYQENNDILSRLSDHLNFYFSTPAGKLRLSASMGSSHYPTNGLNIDTLLKKSDEAVLFAKRLGKNTFKEYEESMDVVRKYENEITNQLHTAIKNKDKSLSILYQPIMNIQDNSSIQECEVLLRWRDKEGKPVPTQDFITIAEKSHLIDEVNLYVIDEVCSQQKKWKEEYKPNKKEIRTSINLSGEAEVVTKLLDRLLFNIERYELKPNLFGIEITERTIFDISEVILKKLTILRDMGMKISLDDFGTGYSSLFYLRKIPLTTVKIDKVFIDEISFNKFDNTIVKSIIKLSHSLGFTVVAEGVEQQDQLDLLKKYCCDHIQGYIYSKPISNKEMLATVT